MLEIRIRKLGRMANKIWHEFDCDNNTKNGCVRNEKIEYYYVVWDCVDRLLLIVKLLLAKDLSQLDMGIHFVIIIIYHRTYLN